MLVAIANPQNLDKFGLQPIDIDQELSLLEEATAGLEIELDQVPQPCTLETIQAKLAEGTHMLHIVAHGGYNQQDDKAVLFLADGDNQVRLVDANEVCRNAGQSADRRAGRTGPQFAAGLSGRLPECGSPQGA